MSDWMPFGTPNGAIPASIQADPRLLSFYKGGPFPLAQTQARYCRLWFDAWAWDTMAMVRGMPSDDPIALTSELEAEATKGKGFGVLVDGETGRCEYFLTRQVTQTEAERVLLRYMDERARDPRKPGDRVIFEDGRMKRRTVSSGHWDHLVKHGL